MEKGTGQKLEYDVQKRAQAGLRATLRAAVAVYIIYLGYRLVSGESSGLQTAAGVFFIVAALAFGAYTWRRWRLDLEAARLPDETPAPADDDGDEPDDDEDWPDGDED